MVKVLLYRMLLGWHIVFQKKTGKKKIEYQLRIWKAIRRGRE